MHKVKRNSRSVPRDSSERRRHTEVDLPRCMFCAKAADAAVSSCSVPGSLEAFPFALTLLSLRMISETGEQHRQSVFSASSFG